jgi:hypothetical protein
MPKPSDRIRELYFSKENNISTNYNANWITAVINFLDEEDEKKETKTYGFSDKTEPCPDVCWREEQIKKQAIKEFADKIMKRSKEFDIYFGWSVSFVSLPTIKGILKEYGIE